MHFRFLFLTLFLCLSCKKDHKTSEVIVIGHAGAGLNTEAGIYHDNSKESVQYALGYQGCEGVEVDVQLSADSVLWLMHNLNLKEQTNRSGCVATMSSSELETVKYTTLKKEKLAKLEEIEAIWLKDKYLFLDMKPYNECLDKTILPARFISAVQQLSYTGVNVFITSTQKDWLHAWSGSGFSQIYSADNFEDAVSALENFNFAGIMIRNAAITDEQVASVKATGKKVAIFEVRSPKGIRSALSKKPDFIVTDDIRATLIEK